MGAERYDIRPYEAVTLLGYGNYVVMRRPDGSRIRKFTRRRAIAAVRSAVAWVYTQDSSSGDYVMITDAKGGEWIYDAPKLGRQQEDLDVPDEITVKKPARVFRRKNA